MSHTATKTIQKKIKKLKENKSPLTPTGRKDKKLLSDHLDHANLLVETFGEKLHSLTITLRNENGHNNFSSGNTKP